MEIKNDEDALNAISEAGLVGVSSYIGMRLFSLQNRTEGNENLKCYYSRDAMTDKAKEWLKKEYPKEEETADEWYARFGMMASFINDHYTNNHE